MKVSKQFKVITGLSLALIMGVSAQAGAVQSPTDVNVYQVPMHFTFDGKEFAPPEGQQGFIYEGTTYVPIRFISYALEKAVNWDPNTYTVTIEEPKATEKININEYKLNTQVYGKTEGKLDKSKVAPTNLKVYKEKVSYVFDGVAKSPSDQLPGYIVDGSLFVPIRFFSESVGKTINWDPETYTVSANTTEKKDPEVKLPETTTKPVTTAPVGGGGASTKVPYDSITSEAESKLTLLLDQSKTELQALYDEYLRTGEKSLISDAVTKLGQIENKFNQIISDTESKLISNGYETTIIDTYKLKYQQMKLDAQKSIIGK